MYGRVKRFAKKEENAVKFVEPFLSYNFHTLKPIIPSQDKSIIVITIDPGIKHLALRIAKKNIDNTIETLFFRRADMYTYEGHNPKLMDSLDPNFFTNYYNNTFKFLNSIKEALCDSHFIVFESQIIDNPDMVRISLFIVGILSSIIKDKGFRPLVIEFDPKLKSKLLGAPKMTKNELKKWCIPIALQYCQEKSDPNRDLIEFLESKQKRDDIADTICMEKVLWILIESDQGLRIKQLFDLGQFHKKIAFINDETQNTQVSSKFNFIKKIKLEETQNTQVSSNNIKKKILFKNIEKAESSDDEKTIKKRLFPKRK